MADFFENTVLRAASAGRISAVETLQTLWKGYGKIVRVTLEGDARKSVVAKHVRLPKSGGGRRGRGEDLSHARKVKSYRVETAWYQGWSGRCDDFCRVPACLAVETRGDVTVLVLEDLDEAGFARRAARADWHEVQACLAWLASFHATFLGCAPDGLWKVGTYWHLDTRPTELAALRDPALRTAASPIDRALRETFQTIVHGDAKIENFCFSKDGLRVAALDFQYVGGGCGMKDVAYFVGSCLSEEEAEALEGQILDCYFSALTETVRRLGKPVDVADLEQSWRALYRVAWTDFHRFYKGWDTVRFLPTSYSERVAAETIGALGGRRHR